ncbi:MAG: hypothetical protein IPH56_04400 [Chitinophagaceae bacterium]|nr:hypothetical protein [Chitinophagaceae bacterium]
MPQAGFERRFYPIYRWRFQPLGRYRLFCNDGQRAKPFKRLRCQRQYFIYGTIWLKTWQQRLIDRLSYAYTSSANKLARVTDAVNDPNTRLGDFKDGANTGADDYLYDVNGNLTQDLNKGIANIVYNQLNLPEFIDLVEKGTVRYTYTAAGTRLKKQVFNRQTQITITTLYLSGFVYETKQDSANNVLYNNKLLFFTGFACDYFIKRPLGQYKGRYYQPKKGRPVPTCQYGNRTSHNRRSLVCQPAANKNFKNHGARLPSRYLYQPQ